MRSLTIEKVDKWISRMTFEYEGVRILEKIAKSSPSCYLMNTQLAKLFPVHDSSSNLGKLADILNDASITIRSYLKDYIVNSLLDTHSYKKIISRKTMFFAFSGDSHLNVINKKILKLNFEDLLPWTIVGQKFQIYEYLFMHTVNLVNIEHEDGVFVGYHKCGAKMNNLFLAGPPQNASKCLRSKTYGIVHFASIIAFTADNSIIKPIEKIQAESEMYQKIAELMKDKTIDFRNQKSEKSIYNWTKERFHTS